MNTNHYYDRIHNIVHYAKLGMWPSKSKGPTPYTEMETGHLRNTIAKCEREGYTTSPRSTR